MDQRKFAITGDVSIEGVPLTSLFTAAMRAKESAKSDDQRQFNDPYAAKLAQPALAAWSQVANAQEENKTRLGLNDFKILQYMLSLILQSTSCDFINMSLIEQFILIKP